MELRPSKAATWSKCPGYVSLVRTTPVTETANDVREDGTACHWLAAESWEGRSVEPGVISPNGRPITQEMVRAVADYHALLTSWPVLRDDIHIEQLAPVSAAFPGVSDGTPDAWAYDTVDDHLYVADLKFGFRPVEVWRNDQMIVYAWSLVCQLMQQGHAPQYATLTICQPRCAHRDGATRSWQVSVSELAELAQKLAAAALACYAPNPQCVVGPQCRSCEVAHVCKSLQAAAGQAVETTYDATPFDLSEQQLGYELAQLLAARTHIDNRIAGLSAQAESLIHKGKRVPAFELGRKVTRWRWREGAEPIIKRLGEMFGVEVTAPAELKSVAKLRNAFPVDVQAMYAEKPTGELTLRMVEPHEIEKAFYAQSVAHRHNN